MIFIVFLLVNLKVDGLSLNTDRWSALDVLIKSILEIKYPYAILDHLGNTTSNLPGLFYIGLPFYLLGDIGFLQPFTFLFLSLFIIQSNIKNDQKVFIFLLILISPAFYWEVIAKSDLMSNCILLLIFICFWQKKFRNKLFKKKGLLAIIVALFCLTRGIVMIPLTLFLFAPFVKIASKKKISFLLYLFFFGVLISLPILFSLPSLDFIIEHNPFNHQTRYAPKILIILSLLVPFFLSFKVKYSSDVFLFSTYIFSGLMLITFGLNIIEEGFYNNVFGDLFDISYLSMILPFIFFYFLESFINIEEGFKNYRN
ncbi:hypothetical protein [Polaribacter sargassicola]|uniref:hypothetical protein n=1 Tax=Polaribacter sargassicola TaxID=2836891 RepID=UPI001F16F43B|nr:hypothetical protein [Polaribacter sp. DS7-9]MCG1036047.1 hypothetical protein [Polaribacter sp. DS7-9]